MWGSGFFLGEEMKLYSIAVILTVLLGMWESVAALGGVGFQASKIARSSGPATGHIHALAIFSRFQDEEDGEASAPGFAGRIFDPQRPGSLTHFYAEMSRGQFMLTGEYLPTWYTADQPAEAYQGSSRSFGTFVGEILSQVDADVDLGQYDNDGADGVPNSGDDDGYVDFIFVITRSAPLDFIVDAATGIAALGLGEDFATGDVARNGGFIRIRADGHRDGVGGVLQQGRSFEMAVGSMAHEFGHVLGLPDLYDLSYDVDDELGLRDSAGIGYWGIMGHGNRGWNEGGGPNPFCAWSLGRLGWLGMNNEQLMVASEEMNDVVFEDVNAGGDIYLLPAGREDEYFLVEYRSRKNSYYERNLPAEGLLIWHVDEWRTSNNEEQTKKVDLVCADGLYIDAGYPRGEVALPIGGGDNLDFWAHQAEYAQEHAGNLGDATDLFDGVRFTDFWAASNPAAPAGISVTNVRRQSEAMVADLKLADRRRAGFIIGEETWRDTIEVVGDVAVPAGGRLIVDSGTTVLFGEDRLSRGVDARRAELVVFGELYVNLSGREPVLFTSGAAAPRPGDWAGISMQPPSRVIMHQAVIEYAVTGLSGESLDALTRNRRALELQEVVIRHTLGDGIRLEGVEEPVTLKGLQVHAAGGTGVFIEGSGLIEISFAHLSGNSAGGLERSGGFIECKESRFVDNGLDAEGGANLIMGQGVFGEVNNNTFSGGVGIRCVGTKEVIIADNMLSNHRIGLISSSARPRILGNQFNRNELVVQVLGFVVPARMDLNVVQEATQLLENRTDRLVKAANNWWGRADEEWIEARMSGSVSWRPFLNFDPRQEVGFTLDQNFPNPFNGSTVIDYTVGINEPIVAGRARTVLEVRNITGGLVRRLVDEEAAPGIFSTIWDGRDEQGRRVASGVYYYQLQVGPITELRRLLFLK